MAAQNEVVGQCVCPLCKQLGANVLKGTHGKYYINCDCCCSLLRSLSRTGSEAMHAMIIPNTPSEKGTHGTASDKPAVVDPLPRGEKKPDAVAVAAAGPAAGTKKKRGSFSDALATLGGRRDG